MSLDREAFWKAVESGDNPLLSVMHGLVEKWGLPAIIMALGDISSILSEDAEVADTVSYTHLTLPTNREV